MNERTKRTNERTNERASAWANEQTRKNGGRNVRPDALGAKHLIPGGWVWFFLLIKTFFSSQQENITFFILWSKANNFFPDMSQSNIFFQDMFKDPFNCETGMCGTVTCRHTVAYRVQADALISATKLIKRYYTNETLPQCYFNVRLTY